MFLLSIVFGPTPTAWAMLYKNEETAAKAYDATLTTAGVIQLVDDFGQCATIKSESVHAVMLEDMEKSKLAQIERGLHQARMQAKAQDMARNDPVLKTAAMTQRQGPSILDPMGGNGQWRG